MVCHKQETGPLHECEVQLDAGQAAAKAAAAPVDKASEEYMASIGKRCDLIALLVTVCRRLRAWCCAGALRAAYSSRRQAVAIT